MADNNELWLRITEDEYPGLSAAARHSLKWQAATDYSLAHSSKLGQLYEQYVIMRTLSERPKE